MKEKECPSCAMNIDADAEVCPICQYEFPKTNKGLQIIAIILIIVVMYFLIF